MKVGVVGAGITGLATVHHCRKRGVDAVCLEARDEPGGVIRSVRVGERVLEAGPQRLRLTAGIEELIAALDLWPEVLTARDDLPLYVYCDGRLREVPRSLRGFLRTDLLSTRAKLRVLGEPLTAPGKPEESAAGLFNRKFGKEAYENLIGPLFGGTYGSDPARMPARHALSGLLQLEAREGSLLKPALKRIVLGETPPPISFDAGLQRLPEALYEAHREHVNLGTPVTAIRRTGTNRAAKVDTERDQGTDNGDDRSDGGFVLVTPDGERWVDRVVVTTDARTAADLLDGVEGVRGTGNLRDLTYNPLAIVHLESEFRGTGFGYQIRWDEGFETLGVTWNASLFDRESVYTAFLGGMGGSETLDRDDGTLGEIAAREFEAVLGYPADVLSVTRWEQGFPAYDGTWDVLDSLSLPEGIDLATNYTARAGVSGRIGQAKRLAKRIEDREVGKTSRTSPATQ